jgi:nitrogen regulatory protein PII
MLKVVVAYIDSVKFEAVRHDLEGIGISHLAVIAAGSATPDPFATLPYRGSPHTSGLTEKLRLEFVVPAEQVESVRDAIFLHAGEKVFMFWMTADQAFPEGAVNAPTTELASEPTM